jgi:hypothetical protein
LYAHHSEVFQMSDAPALRVALYAGDVEVASSSDNKIWLAAMAAITGVSAPEVQPLHKAGEASARDLYTPGKPPAGIAALADELGVSVNELVAACNPMPDKPFIELEHRNWEALKANSAPRGPGSVSGTVLAATLLLLWARYADVGKVTTSTCTAVIQTIGHSERNQARSLRNCDWIQVRDDGLRLNPARVAAAHKLARAYILRTPLE